MMGSAECAYRLEFSHAKCFSIQKRIYLVVRIVLELVPQWATTGAPVVLVLFLMHRFFLKRWLAPSESFVLKTALNGWLYDLKVRRYVEIARGVKAMVAHV